MSSPSLMFGGCGCGRNVTGGFDYQYAMAVVPYGFGFLPTGTPGLSYTNIPVQFYLKATWDIQDTTTKAIIGTGSITYDVFGNYTTDAILLNVGGDTGTTTINYRVSDAYTYEQAAANAINLLGQIALLDTQKQYYAQASTNGGDTWLPARPVNLCYASEASAFDNPTQLLIAAYNSGTLVTYNSKVIGNQGAGTTVQFFTDGGAYIPVQLLGQPNAQNGYFAYVGLNPTILGLCYAAQSAVRSPTPFLSQTSFNFTPGQYIQPINPTTTIEPINQPAGEYILTPADVPGFGWVSWSGNAAPNLSAAKTTADSTTTTADSTTQTADTD